MIARVKRGRRLLPWVAGLVLMGCLDPQCELGTLRCGEEGVEQCEVGCGEPRCPDRQWRMLTRCESYQTCVEQEDGKPACIASQRDSR